MDNNEIKLINAVIKENHWLRVTQEIGEEPENTWHKGKFEIGTEKGTLLFDVNISSDFPFGRIDFVCSSHKGYNHMMHYGNLCLNASPASTIGDRLKLELEKLSLWVQKYFVNEKTDTHFEYYQFYQQRKIEVVFEEDEGKDPVINSHGKFTYSELNHLVDPKDMRTWIALDLGGRKCRWSAKYLDRFKDKYVGLWIKLNRPPVVERRQSIENWKDLLEIMTPEQSKYISDNYLSLKKTSGYLNGFLLMVGYDIPSVSGTEIHWDGILIHHENFPYSAVKVAPGKYEPEDRGEMVDWCKSNNASYKRIFGRGKLTDALTEKKILIIGTGAIGSNLFISLVRGGCKKIEISEFDDIEPGNVCRGQFQFTNVQKPKIFELLVAGLSISPYLELGISAGILPVAKSNIRYAVLKEKLHGFDFIFDCSTDKYLSIMLDEMQLSGQVINFSITDEAKQMAVVTGVGNIHKIKSLLYDRLVPSQSEPFFVATGCWHPTFQASYLDINVLLSYALNELNLKLENKKTVNSFYITKDISTDYSLKYTLDYNV